MGLLAIVGAGFVAVAPRAERALSDRAARRLADLWSQRAADDAARWSALTAVRGRLGVGDLAVLIGAVVSVDRQEVDALTRLIASVTARRGWVADVDRAKRAVLAAVRADRSDVRADEASAARLRQPAVPLAVTARTSELIAQADKLVAAMVTAHRVHYQVAQAPVFTVASYLSRLAEPTDGRTGIRLLLSDAADGVRLVDADTGSSRQLLAAPGDSSVSVWRLGRSVLAQRGLHWSMLTLPSGRRTALPQADAYLAGGGTAWRVFGHTVQPYDVSGRARGPATPLPAGLTPTQAAGATGLVLGAATDIVRSDIPFYLWTPATGALQQVAVGCADVDATTPTIVVLSGCRRSTYQYYNDANAHFAVIYHPVTRERFTVQAPRGFAFTGQLTLTVNGHWCAAAVASDTARRIMVIDTRSGRSELVPSSEGLTPVMWTSDNRTLIVEETATGSQPANARPLGYWRLHDSEIRSIRVPVQPNDGPLAVIAAS